MGIDSPLCLPMRHSSCWSLWSAWKTPANKKKQNKSTCMHVVFGGTWCLSSPVPNPPSLQTHVHIAPGCLIHNSLSKVGRDVPALDKNKVNFLYPQFSLKVRRITFTSGLDIVQQPVFQKVKKSLCSVAWVNVHPSNYTQTSCKRSVLWHLAAFALIRRHFLFADLLWLLFS